MCISLAKIKVTVRAAFHLELQCPQAGVLKPLFLQMTEERSGKILSIAYLSFLYCLWISRQACTPQIWMRPFNP